MADLSKPNKPAPDQTKKATYLALSKFLRRLGKPITQTAISELVQFKKNNPNDTSLEVKLKLWKAEATSSRILNHIAHVLGVFKRD